MSPRRISFDLHLSNRLFKANLHSLLKLSVASIKHQQKEEERFIKQLQKKDTKDWMGKASHYANIDWLLLNSMFLSVYSLFEHHMFILARIVERHNTTKIKIEDFTGNGILKYCNYLFLVGQIGGADRTKKIWSDLGNYQKVRNLIAHNGGIMLKDASKKLENHELYNFLRKRNVIMLGTIGHIRIKNQEFLKVFNEIVSKISDELTIEISKAFGIKDKSR